MSDAKDTIIIGDGPGGLSAGLFLARGGYAVTIFGQDKTAMHWALLNNYLGIPQITGADFQGVARGQVDAAGATLRDEAVSAVQRTDAGFEVTTEGGETLTASFVILSEGKSPKIARALGLEVDEDGAVAVDRNSRSALDGLYVVGRSTRPGRSQAIISAGDGAAAAIDILSRQAGKSVCDWDSPPSDS